MAIDVPGRDTDQVKVTGAELDQVVEVSENSDGGPNKADHLTVDTARVHDHGISPRDHENQSSQRIIRQDVKKAGTSPGLAFGHSLPGTFKSVVGRKSEPVAAIADAPGGPYDTFPFGVNWLFTLDGLASVGGSGADGIERSIVSYLWDLSGAPFFAIVGGTTSSPSILLINFGPPGTWPVTLTVTDALGKTATVTVGIVTVP